MTIDLFCSLWAEGNYPELIITDSTFGPTAPSSIEVINAEASDITMDDISTDETGLQFIEDYLMRLNQQN